MQQPTIKQLQATDKVYLLRSQMNDDNLSELLQIAKGTLYTRLRKSNWSNREILFIEYQTNNSFRMIVDKLKIF